MLIIAVKQTMNYSNGLLLYTVDKQRRTSFYGSSCLSLYNESIYIHFTNAAVCRDNLRRKEYRRDLKPKVI